MFKKIAIAVLCILAVFVIVVTLQEPGFTVTRSAMVAAPPEVIFAQVNDFHKWAAWSPWEKMDPGMKRTYEGPESGEGATYSWAGNDKVGEGKMTIVKNQVPQRIEIQLEIYKPWKATNQTVFAFVYLGDQTEVKWSMSGRKDFVSKAFCLFMNMDKMVGGDFEKGLEQLKSVAESQAKSAAAAPPAPAAPQPVKK